MSTFAEPIRAELGVIGCFFLAFLLATFLIRWCIPKLQAGIVETKSAQKAGDPIQALIETGRLPESSSDAIFDWKSTGFWIGFCETFLIFVLVFADAFSALAIIIGAKQFVRNENIRQNPSYYLLGTLANLSVAILFALIAKHIWLDLL